MILQHASTPLSMMSRVFVQALNTLNVFHIFHNTEENVMKSRMIILLCLILIVPGFGRPRRKAKPSRWAMGIHLLLSFPQSDSANATKSGEGLGGKVLFHFPNIPNFALRGDFGYLSFGETRAQFVGYGMVQTRKEAFRFAVGPQFQTQIKKFKVYFAPLISIYNYRSVLSYQYYGYGSGYAETKESDTKLGWSLSGGFMLDIGLGPLIDVGLKYHHRSDDIQTNVGKIVPKDEVSANIGVVFFFKK